MCEGKEMLGSEKKTKNSMGKHLLQQRGKQNGKKKRISGFIALGIAGKSVVNWDVKEAAGLGSPQCSESHRRSVGDKTIL